MHVKFRILRLYGHVCMLCLGFMYSKVHVKFNLWIQGNVCLLWFASIGKCTLNLGYGYMDMYVCYV